MKKVIIFFLLLAVCAAVLGALYFWNKVSFPNSTDTQQVLFTVAKGESVKAIGIDLKRQGLIRDQFWFETFVYFDRSEEKFIAGTYQLKKNMNIREIVNLLTSGKVSPEDQITIIEGESINKIADDLEKQGIISKEDFIKAALATDTRTIIPETTYGFLADKPSSQGLEGYLFPDTYRVYKDAQPTDIIKKMLDNFGDKYTQQMREDTIKGNLTIYQVVTLASIIQKETNIELENGKPLNNDHYVVAGIFYNRLNNNMPLESDATVNYVTGGDRPQPTSDDLQVDSPYNTYKYKGLPPGPIGNPSLEAIRAAIYPEKTEYFYFLHKIHDDGSTVFSKTYEEHLENKRKYLQ